MSVCVCVSGPARVCIHIDKCVCLYKLECVLLCYCASECTASGFLMSAGVCVCCVCVVCVLCVCVVCVLCVCVVCVLVAARSCIRRRIVHKAIQGI